jgi:hypothetical protein
MSKKARPAISSLGEETPPSAGSTAALRPDVSGMDANAREEALRAAMGESMDRFEETYRLLAAEQLSDDPPP